MITERPCPLINCTLVANSSSNTYTGPTVVSGGTLVPSSPTSLPSGTSFDVGSGGTLVLLGGSLPSAPSDATSSTVAAQAVAAQIQKVIPVLCPAVWVVHQNPSSSAACLSVGVVGQTVNLPEMAQTAKGPVSCQVANLSETRQIGNLPARDNRSAGLGPAS